MTVGANTIPLSVPDVGQLEVDFVLDALASGWVAPLGPHVAAFEEEVAERVGVGHAVALSSGTAALHLALVAWGVGPTDVVVIPTMTFAATVNAVRYVGATPFFVDVQDNDGTVNVELLDQALHDLTPQSDVPVVIPVDLFGWCADADRVETLAAGHGAHVLVDSAESFGSRRDGWTAGSRGDAAILSFNGNKVMTTSGGGMLLTDDADLAHQARYLATQARQPVRHYEHTDVGYNYRLSNVLAALGRAQLRRLDEMITRRRLVRDRYAEIFSGTPGVRMLGTDAPDANCWLSVVVADPDAAGWAVEQLAEYLDGERIETRPVWKPMHQQPVFANFPTLLDGTADRLFERGLVLPSGSAMTTADLDRLGDRLLHWLGRG